MVYERAFNEKTDAIVIYGESNRNLHQAVRIFNEIYPENPISRHYYRKLLQTFFNSGTVNSKKRSGRKQISEEKQIQIVATVVNNPHHSTEKVSEECEVSATTARKYLKKNKFHPYKINLVHQLSEDDPDRRMQFCDTMCEKIRLFPNYVKHICFSDESTFFLNGKVNRQNVRYWSDVNPHIFREGHTQFPEKVNVWAGILGNHIVGPIFINENLTGEL